MILPDYLNEENLGSNHSPSFIVRKKKEKRKKLAYINIIFVNRMKNIFNCYFFA